MLIFCDQNKSLVEKVKAVMPADFWGEPIKVIEGDIFQVAKDNGCLIATASNPQFTMGGGLDALIKNNFPEECKKPVAWTKSEHLYFVLTVDDKIQTGKEIVKTALMNIFGNRHLNIAFTGLGTGIGDLSEDDFIEVLKSVLIASRLSFTALEIKGYKAFDDGWKCRDKKYVVGQDYNESDISICNRGMHFCRKATSILEFYNNPFFIAEVIGSGKAEEENNKVCVSNMKVVNDITWNRSNLMNSGDRNSGYYNSGDYNSGDYNSGDRNSGYYNSGYYNSGDYNSGDYNSGDRNSGYYNSGDRNSGDYNSGDYNSGDYNSGDYNSGHHNSGDRNSGIFNTDEPMMRSFNKMTKIKLSEYINSDKYVYFELPINIYVWSSDMTDKEKENHPEWKTTGGYLKKLSYKEAWAKWWESNQDRKDKIKKIPNFDKKLFKEITGIEIK